MQNENPNDLTRRHVRPDPEQMQPYLSPTPGPTEETIRAPVVTPPQQPPAPSPPYARPAYTRRRRRRMRVPCLGCLLRVALALGLFLVVFVVMAVVMYRLFPPPRTNVLILGVDARPEEADVTRTDTMILATIDPAQPYMGMLAIPRDLWVDIPGYGPQRINAAHVFAEVDEPGSGPALAMQTVEANFGVPVAHYLRLNFEGFVQIVDAAGGVTIDVDNYMIDYEYPTIDYGVMVVEFQAGRQHMDGERALQYARLRHGTAGMDRSRRQMQVITALARQLIRPDNWWRIPLVYAAFAQHVDTNLSIFDAVGLGPAVLWVGPGGIDSRVFDETMYFARTTAAGASVQEPIWEGINPVVDEMFRR